MKKTYIIPQVEAVYTAQTLLQAASVTINHSGSVNAADVDVKSSRKEGYDVWNEDWSE